MSIFTALITLLFLPAQFYFAGLFLKPATQEATPMEKVEGASDIKEPGDAESSFRQAIVDSGRSNAGSENPEAVPQKKYTYQAADVLAGSSVVIDTESGTILHYDKGRYHLPIASLTKIMTAILVMEKVKDLDEPITIDSEALAVVPVRVGCPSSDSSLCVAPLRIGEEMTMRNLMTAMLIDSANDAAIAIGKHIAGSQEAFAALMNEKTKELNLIDTHFCNPSGLDAAGCYSSAYDLARIAAYSTKYDMLWEIMNTSEATVRSIDGKYEHQLKNTDMLLGQVPNCLGGKTGFTYNAGKSLMLSAADPETGKHKIIAVILNDDNRWNDMRNLLDWTFANYEWK